MICKKLSCFGAFCLMLILVLTPNLSNARGISLSNHAAYSFSNDLSVSVSLRGGAEILFYRFDFSDEIERTYAHPADSATGYTDANLEEGYAGALKLGASGGFVYKQIMLYGGYDYRFNGAGESYAEELANYGGESYAYTLVTNGAQTPIPFWGVKYYLPEFDFGFYFEMGYPTSKFHIETGHYRWDHHDAVRSDTWEGSGSRYVLGAEGLPWGFETQHFDFITMQQIYIFYEDYDVEFFDEDAQISLWGFAFTASINAFPY
ncbi:hypothetical protein ACFL2U_00520 [Patescibacteria group bacterium]